MNIDVTVANADRVQKIALCHLESLSCLPAVNLVFREFGDRIGLVLVSRRFGSSHGGFFTQLAANVRTSGVRMTFWLGFDLIAAQVVGAIARVIPFGRTGRLETLPALARRHGATLVHTADINGQASLDRIGAYGPDLLLVMNFDQILQPPVIAVPRFGAVNVHPSLLPELRGPCPVFWALAEGRRASGVTVHAIEDARIDAGTILRQADRAIDPRQSVAEISTRLFLRGADLLKDALAASAAASPAPVVVSTEKGRAGSYRGFPRRAQVAAARRIGVRLCTIGFAVRLIAAALGVGRVP